MRRVLRIGSRGSYLALWQAESVSSIIKADFPDIDTEIVVIKTTGDRFVDSPLFKIGGKGVFVKEIEEALLRGEVDIAVHSMKDLPTSLPPGLVIGAVIRRGDPRDALVSDKGVSFSGLPEGAVIGTSSLRRKAQLLNLRPDLKLVPLRGNVDTRLKKLKKEGLDAVVLAMAALNRMGFEKEVSECFPVDVVVPAPGQGAIAVECRKDDGETVSLLSRINHGDSFKAVGCERSFLERLGGGCQVPVGCYAEVRGRIIRAVGLVASTDGREVVRDSIEGPVDDYKNLGKELAERILSKGGRDILLKLTS
ncbi:Porphobilinogen deaminase [bacterium HR37]|nr:Porphobilinogen deaminase [bacterium HR37]